MVWLERSHDLNLQGKAAGDHILTEGLHGALLSE
jgi:hypothetical protein